MYYPISSRLMFKIVLYPISSICPGREAADTMHIGMIGSISDHYHISAPNFIPSLMAWQRSAVSLPITLHALHTVS
jgi:hypothetical protein